MDILKYIPFGERNAVSLTSLVIKTGLSSRKVRKEIEKARRDAVILNAQNGKGYFRPLKEDGGKVRRWIAQERSRADKVLTGVRTAEERIREYE